VQPLLLGTLRRGRMCEFKPYFDSVSMDGYNVIDLFLKPEKLLNPLLKMAVLSGIQTAVRLHIRRRIEINHIDEGGRSPLILEAIKGHTETCKILLEAGADPRIQDNKGNDALSIALNKKLESLAYLLKKSLSELDNNVDAGALQSHHESMELDRLKKSLDSAYSGATGVDRAGWITC
jgi:RNA polymerase primary sigma factor